MNDCDCDCANPIEYLNARRAAEEEILHYGRQLEKLRQELVEALETEEGRHIVDLEEQIKSLRVKFKGAEREFDQATEGLSKFRIDGPKKMSDALTDLQINFMGYFLAGYVPRGADVPGPRDAKPDKIIKCMMADQSKWNVEPLLRYALDAFWNEAWREAKGRDINQAEKDYIEAFKADDIEVGAKFVSCNNFSIRRVYMYLRWHRPQEESAVEVAIKLNDFGRRCYKVDNPEKYEDDFANPAIPKGIQPFQLTADDE
jgi:hypothetical protein